MIEFLVVYIFVFDLFDLMLFNLNFAPKHAKLVICDEKCVVPIHSHCPNRKSPKLIN